LKLENNPQNKGCTYQIKTPFKQKYSKPKIFLTQHIIKKCKYNKKKEKEKKIKKKKRKI